MKRFLFILALICSCSAFVHADDIVSGTVVNEKGDPVVDATIKVKHVFLDQWHSDANGHFELKILMSTFELTVSASGYESFTHTYTKEQGQDLVLETIVLKKTPLKALFKRDDSKNGKFDQPILNIGVQQGWRTMGQVSIGICDQRFRFKKIMPMWHLRQIHVGANFILRDDPIIGPKICYDATTDGFGMLGIMTCGIDGIYYMDSRYSGFYLNPHLGFTAFSYINIVLGYNIPMQKSEMNKLVNHFDVSVSLPLFWRMTDKTFK